MNVDQLLEVMEVAIPVDRSGDVEVRQFDVSPAEEQFQRLRTAITGDQRVCPAGRYTGLWRSGVLWMSDTPDERTDSLICLCHARRLGARTALVNGLGLGSVLRGLMAVGVASIDVVEVDQDVINLVGPTCMRLAASHGADLRIHRGNAYTIKLDGQWDIVWSDIWESVSSSNLSEMDRLTRRYRNRCRWHGHWGRELILNGMRPTTYQCGNCPEFGIILKCAYEMQTITNLEL